MNSMSQLIMIIVNIFYHDQVFLGIHARRKVRGILSPNPAADNRTIFASS